MENKLKAYEKLLNIFSDYLKQRSEDMGSINYDFFIGRKVAYEDALEELTKLKAKLEADNENSVN